MPFVLKGRRATRAYGYTLVELMVSIVIVLLGPGAYSVDAILFG